MENLKLKCIGQASWQRIGGLGHTITNAEVSLRKVMAIPFCTGIVLYVTKVYCVTNALMSND
ncbi:hypothetical protein CBEIBR21_00445 [Clostridium beijerinckii]|uniref:Uncharacterized protein n=1 Tax=Clostridium beijerinckii TaxID=1520 RepID=A0A1S9NB93_CLOBE|nr:hypothetical protein CBEIBR21_00445 [Clostridium beijerinckii]